MTISRNEVWQVDAPSYDRTWEEIEALLDEAITEMKMQHARYMLRKETGPRMDK